MKKVLKSKSVILIAALMLFGNADVFSQSVSKVGTTAAQFLKIPVGTKETALGSATTAIVNGPTSMFWNPAGIAGQTTKSFIIEYTDWFIDLDHTYVGAVLPLNKGSLGFNVVGLNMGEFEETIYGRDFEPTGRTFRAYSLAFGSSYATYLFESLKFGVNAKYIVESIDFSSASTFGFDVGAIYNTPIEQLTFGVSVQNIGGEMQMFGDNLTTTTDLNGSEEGDYEPDVRLATDGFDLPLTLRVGFGIKATDQKNFKTTIAIDGVSPSDNVQHLNVGIDIALLEELLSVRAGLPGIGIDDSDRIEQFTLGVGINYEFSENLGFNFGYSYQNYEYLGDVSRVSVEIEF